MVVAALVASRVTPNWGESRDLLGWNAAFWGALQLTEFVLWYLRVCLDQINFMESLFELDNLGLRLKAYVERSASLKPEAFRLLEEALIRGQFDRGESARITGLPDRIARRVLADVLDAGLLGSATPKGPVSLRFPTEALDVLFPRLFPET